MIFIRSFIITIVITMLFTLLSAFHYPIYAQNQFEWKQIKNKATLSFGKPFPFISTSSPNIDPPMPYEYKLSLQHVVKSGYQFEPQLFLKSFSVYFLKYALPLYLLFSVVYLYGKRRLRYQDS